MGLKITLPAWMRSIQTRMIVATLLVSLIPMAIAAEVATRMITGIIDHDVNIWLQESAKYFLKNFEDTRREGSALGAYFAEHEITLPEKGISAHGIQLADALGYDLVLISDSDGKVVWSNIAVESFERLPADTDQSLYEIRSNHRTGLMVAGAYEFLANSQRYRLIVGNWLDENFVESLKSVASLDIRLYRRDTKGFRALYSSRRRVAEDSYLPAAVVEELASSEGPIYDPEAHNGRYRAVYVPLHNPKGELVGVISSALRATELSDFWYLPTNFFLIIFALGTLLSALIGFVVSRRLSRPLRRLAQGVRSVADGDYSQRVDTSGEDEVAELASTFNLMTERLGKMQQLEGELRRRDRLSALGEIAVGIAHEVRNPLGTIKTSADLLRRSATLDHNDSRMLGYVVEEVRRIENLINEFLAFARPREPQIRQIKPAAVVERVARFCDPQLNRYNVVLEVVDQAPDIMVQADEDHLFEAALNLVLNAIDAMEQGGRLLVTLSRQEGMAVISFTDTGPGVPQEIIERIFNPFFTTKPQGTGLGLAKVFAVMEHHGGRVECKSPAGKGATFSLMLPEFIPPASHPAPTSTSQPPTSPSQPSSLPQPQSKPQGLQDAAGVLMSGNNPGGALPPSP